MINRFDPINLTHGIAELDVLILFLRVEWSISSELIEQSPIERNVWLERGNNDANSDTPTVAVIYQISCSSVPLHPNWSSLTDHPDARISELVTRTSPVLFKISLRI
jgi:hypothetical protein